MNTSCPDCQVLVVGAGPTGLVLAAELLARGIRTRIIDKGDGIALESRAIGIHARTLEVLDLMGMAERFIERGQVVRRLSFYSQGRHQVSLEFGHCGSPYGFLLDLPQDETQRLLRDRVAELGGVVEQRSELAGLTVGSDAVSAVVTDTSGRAESITASYVVGCDGAHSRVRRELGLSFDGHPYPQDWLLADVLIDWDLAEDTAHVFFRPDGLPVIFFPMRGHRWRLTLPFAGSRSPEAPTLAEIQMLTDERAPVPVTVSDPTWLANFRCHRRSASAYRRGRALLAGDAVHIHTPAGGQGMNTGIMDAHNLGWKLALVASGRAGESLLDSYGTERRPVAEDVLKLTHTLVRYGTMSHPVKRKIRDTVVPALGSMAVVQRRTARRLTHVGVTYPAGPLARPDSRRSAPRPGQRMADADVHLNGNATTLHQVLGRGRHVLVIPAGYSAADLRGLDLARYLDDVDIVTADVARTAGAVLVRPDGHVAARARPGSAGAVAGYLGDLLGQNAPVPSGVPSPVGAS
jgi:2-polyprenyl-6-methoxyphenol hydroxylase-like FAD-dependent oxidoreductase